MAYLLHHLLTESAERFPNREAIRFQGEGLSYTELDRLTNQLARSLQNAGVKRGDRVGLYVHKSLATVIGVFGIMKAGAAYVPLDPNAPAKRHAYITRNCDIKVVVTATNKLKVLSEFFAEGTPVETAVLTDSDEHDPVEMPENVTITSWDDVRTLDNSPVPSPGTIETDLAYILYTSGSTGTPKGVMIAHRTIFTFVNWCVETFNMTEADRVTSHAPIHFDLSTFDMYATIKAGGSVVLVPEKLSVFPVQLVRLLQDEEITMTYMVPSILSLMVNYGKLAKHDLSNLRTILFAGEVFPIKYLRKLVALVPHVDYYNLYGPTETNVCTYYKVQPKDVADDVNVPVPIGKACENMEVFAVDEDGNLVTEPGKEGELWARGSCVAQGYWGDPEKTAKGFVQNIHQPNYFELSYRTGDVVYLDDDGVNWRYVGRRDHMVKSRGYRIELGDIESALYAHESIKEAAVIAIPDDLVGSRIKAFVVTHEHKNGLNAKDIQSHVGSRLPRYMVPEMIEFRDDLPKTSTGKINRPELAKV
ncbi:MAG: amino acid adenylation domain-containing protein [Anaerolineales bacterium]|nr:amino acid adenylation domain-containing protein [Anaerolineales bacterium]